jgi:hypothetical protein
MNLITFFFDAREIFLTCLLRLPGLPRGSRRLDGARAENERRRRFAARESPAEEKIARSKKILVFPTRLVYNSIKTETDWRFRRVFATASELANVDVPTGET